MPFRYERAAARSGPSSWTRLRARGSTLTRAAPRPSRRRAAALPLGQAPQVAAHPRRIQLPADQVHVGLADHAALVRGQRHPLGQHVVGGGQARVAVAVQVGELDAVLAQQRPVLGHVGDDRLVRVDQVGVRPARGRGRAPRPRARPGGAAVPRAGSPGRGTSPTPPRSRTNAAAGARAARRGARGQGRSPAVATGGRRVARAAAAGREPRLRPQRAASGAARAAATTAMTSRASSISGRSAASCAGEEDHPLRRRRDLGVVADHQRLAPAAARVLAWAPRPTCRRRAGGGTPPPAVPRPRHSADRPP